MNLSIMSRNRSFIFKITHTRDEQVAEKHAF